MSQKIDKIELILQSSGTIYTIATQSGNSILSISSTGEIGIGTTSPTSRVHIKGTGTSSGTYSLKIDNNDNNALLYVRNDGNVGIGTSTPNHKLSIDGPANTTLYLNSSGANGAIIVDSLVYPIFQLRTNTVPDITHQGIGSGNSLIDIPTSLQVREAASSITRFGFADMNSNPYSYFRLNLAVGAPVIPSASLHVKGIGTNSGTYSLKIDDGSNNPLFYVNDAGNVGISNANPTASLHIKYGATFTTPKDLLHIQQWYNDYSILRIYDNGSSAGSQVTSDRGFWTFGENIGVGITADIPGGNRVSIKGNSSNNSTAALIIKNSSDNYTFTVLDNGNVGVGLVNATTKLHVYATQSGAFRIQDGTQNTNYILVSDANGVGTWTNPYSITTATPSLTAVTNVGGTSSTDIEITDNTKGIILKSSNGTRWRVTVDNSGALITTSI